MGKTRGQELGLTGKFSPRKLVGGAQKKLSTIRKKVWEVGEPFGDIDSNVEIEVLQVLQAIDNLSEKLEEVEEWLGEKDAYDF